MKKLSIFVSAINSDIGLSIFEKLCPQTEMAAGTFRTENGNLDKLRALAGHRGIELHCHQLDYLDDNIETNLQTIADTYDHFDCLINAVGDAIKRSSFEKAGLNLWKDSLKLNLYSAVATSNILLPLLKKSNNPTIINISSISAKHSGAPDSLHYGVAKSGIETLTIGLAKELGPFGIRCVCISPSAIDTNFQAKHSSSDRLARIVAETPIGRIGNPEEISNLVEFLISGKCDFLNGEIIYLTGGR